MPGFAFRSSTVDRASTPPTIEWMRVRVDGELCHGHQACAISAPEVFGSDDYGNAVVLIEGPIPAELEAATRRAEGNCPEHAVIITADH